MKPFALARALTQMLASVKVRVTLAAVAALVFGIGFITLLMIERIERDLRIADIRRESSQAVQTAALLARKVVSLQRALQFTSLELDATMLADRTAMDRFVASKPILLGLFDALYVASVEGVLYSRYPQSVNPAKDLYVGDREYFRQTLAQDRAIISAPLVSRATGAPVLVFSQPVWRGSRIVAVLGGTLRLSNRELLEGMVETSETDDASLVVVSDATGRILAHPDPRQVMRWLTDEPRLTGAFADWSSMGSPVEPMGLRLTQEGAVVSAAGVPGPDWVVWRARPESELLEPLRNARHYALGWAGAMVVVVSSALLVLLWWLLRPLTLLQRRSQHLFDGALAPDIGWPGASGEIGALERVLQQVATQRAEWETLNSQLLGRLGLVLSAAPVGIVFTQDDRFELVSAELCRMFARSEASFLQQPLHVIFALWEDFEVFSTQKRLAFQTDQTYVGDWQMVRADGTRFWARLRCKPVDLGNLALGSIWTVVDVEKQKSVLEQLEWSATHDVLTGLTNRQVLQQRAQRLVDDTSRRSPAVLLFLDLDHFKPVNDNAGHIAGDVVLLSVANAISGCVRHGDLVTRLGGDEFTLLLENCSEDIAWSIAQEVLAAIIAVEVPWKGTTLQVSASIGLALLAPEIDTVTAWITAADVACYAAKAAGRGRISRA